MENRNIKFKNNCIKIFGGFLLFAILASFIFPFSANAALVPCGKKGDSGMCTLCDLIVGIKGIMDYGFKIMVIVAIAMVTIAGIVYIISAGDEGMMSTAKHLLKNALIGFAIILGAWLMINTTMRILGAKSDLGIGVTGWNTFTCDK